MNEAVIVLLFFLLMESDHGASSLVIPGSSAGPPPPPTYAPAANAPPVPPPPPSGLGVFNPVLSLPGVGQAFAVLKPIADNVTTPLINKLNSKLGTSASPYAPGLPGTGDLNVQINANGTQTVSVKHPNWYSRNIGEPISKTATGFVHALESLW